MSAVCLPREDGKVGLAILSNSEIACFRRCAREYAFRYVMRRRPRRSSEALRFGTFFHIGLNTWWSTKGDAADKLAAAVDAIRARADANPEDADPFELVKAEELLLGYTARWGDDVYETLGVEVAFEMPLVNPDTGAASRTFRVAGKIDLIARRANGAVVFGEHKTTSNDITPGSDYWRRVSALDPQVSTYDAAMRSLGYDPKECLYDVVRKVDKRPYKATPEESRRYTKAGRLDSRQHENDETPEEFRLRVREDISEKPEKYFARGPIVRLEKDEAEHAADVWHTAWFIRESRNAERFPRSPNACERFHKLCDYFDVCSGVASIGDDARFRTAATAHEELVPDEKEI